MSTTALAPAAPPALPRPAEPTLAAVHQLRPRPSAPATPALVSDGLVCPLESGAEVEYANLDHGASTSAFVAVKAAVDEASLTYSSVHRGNGYASRVTSARYEQAREVVARFVGARADDHVIFTRNTTDSFNLLASVVPQDAQVFVFGSDHHATILPWRAEQLVRLPVPASPAEAVSVVDAALRTSRAADALVVVTGASNVTGEYWPVAQIAAVARRHGARVALDAAQLVQHRAVDLALEELDYVAFSGHKIYAPYGAGVLVGRSDWLDAAEPYLAGGGATAAVSDEDTTWQIGPARHEAGSPNVLGAVALAVACEVVDEHREAIAALDETLGRGLVSRLDAIPGVQTHSIFGPTHDRAPVVTFTVEGRSAQEVSRRLSDEHGIGVRDGRFCAHVLVDALLARQGSGSTSAVRASLGLANSPEHVDRLVAAVRSLAPRG